MGYKLVRIVTKNAVAELGEAETTVYTYWDDVMDREVYSTSPFGPADEVVELRARARPTKTIADGIIETVWTAIDDA